mgnify:CR=1 FL=1|tara:strand:- start:5433 stop:5825 length:393 start_codon:yes stop_codon:yes gene_type:complete
MPLYDVRCTDSCGYFNDVFVLLADIDKIICPSCSKPVVRLVRPVATIGPMPSKPLRVDQIGRSFESASDWRDYQQKNGDVEILSATGNKWRAHKDIVRTKAESKAKAQGFRDLEDKRSHFRKGDSTTDRG